MQTFITILLVVGGLFIGGYSKMRKALQEFDAQPTSPSPEKAHQEVPQQQEEEGQSDYFTYDTVESAEKPLAQPVTEKENFLEDALSEESSSITDVSSAFDLRQAVIYQTILQNDYIADLK